MVLFKGRNYYALYLRERERAREREEIELRFGYSNVEHKNVSCYYFWITRRNKTWWLLYINNAIERMLKNISFQEDSKP